MQNFPYQMKIFGHNFGTKMQHGADYGQQLQVLYKIG